MTPSASRPLRLGLLGASRIAPKAVIRPAAETRAGTALRVGARDAARAEAYAREHDLARFGSYEDVLGDAEVDVVYNALPASHHALWTIRALEADKHVLCEKPFAMNADEAEAVLAASARTGCRVIEAYHSRYHPLYRRFLAWMAAGRAGRVTRIEAGFDAPITRPGDIRHAPETGGGAMMDLGCYALLWARDAAGAEPDSVIAEASLRPEGVDEAVRARLSFPGGIEAVVLTDMGAQAERRNWLRVEGEAGRIDFGNPLAPQDGASLTLTRGGEVERAPAEEGTTYGHQLLALARGLETGERLPTEGEAILRQQRALDAVYAAAGLGELRRTRVPFG